MVFSLPTPEGKAINVSSTWQYEFFYTDHLGNTRDSFSAVGNNLVVKDISHFDPTGILLKDAGQINGTENRFLYQNKESLALFGLSGVNDFGARFLDKTIGGRFWQIDPLADIAGRFSPYAYGYNNPLLFVDPNGMEARLTQDVMYSDGYSTQSYRNGTGSIGFSGNLLGDSDPKYSASSDNKGGTIITRTQGSSTLTLTGEDANLFKVLGIEGGYSGTTESREGEYGMAIIMASILNRVEIGYKPDRKTKAAKTIQDVISQRNGREYNAYVDNRYKNNKLFNKYLTDSRNIYKSDAATFFDLVLGLTTRQINPYQILENNGFKNAHQILAYQHNGPYPLYSGNSVMLRFNDIKTHLKSVQSHWGYYPYYIFEVYSN